MSNKLLVEVNLFAKLLSAFYDKKASGNEDELQKIADKSNNKAFQKAYNAWQSDSEKLLLSTRKLLQQSGLDTKDIDNLLKKYHS